MVKSTSRPRWYVKLDLIYYFVRSSDVGTSETGEARASPEIRGCLKSNSQIGKKRNMSGILFFSASPEIILFLRP